MTAEPTDESQATADASPVSLRLRSLTFSGGQEVELEPDTILVLVGPNNAGKSRSLRDIQRNLRREQPLRVVTKVEISMNGDRAATESWVKDHFVPIERGRYKGIGGTIDADDIKRWGTLPVPKGMVDHLCVLATAENRFEVLRKPSLINPLLDPETHPLHFLLTHPGTEEWLGQLVNESFDVDVILNRGAGEKLQMHCGTRPTGLDRVGMEYLRALEKLPTLEDQGDGLRSFYACLVQVLLGAWSLVLVDEPEMFLHPPQAEKLGEILASEAPRDRQLIIATHSADLLRGMLKHAANRIKLVRIVRRDAVNLVSELSPAGVQALWQDPSLRFTNALDALFHQSVVICESDADCRFYDAVLEAACDTRAKPMFVPSGGKQAIKRLITVLNSLGVPWSAVADFDVLNDRNVLRPLWEAAGGSWSEIEPLWTIVRDAVEVNSTVQHRGKVLEAVKTLLNGPPNERITEAEADKIREIAKSANGWMRVKTAGSAALPQGAPAEAAERLLKVMATRRVFVVPVGELERFVPTVGGKSGSWVTAVLQTFDLKTDTALAAARDFVAAFANAPAPTAVVPAKRPLLRRVDLPAENWTSET